MRWSILAFYVLFSPAIAASVQAIWLKADWFSAILGNYIFFAIPALALGLTVGRYNFKETRKGLTIYFSIIPICSALLLIFLISLCYARMTNPPFEFCVVRKLEVVCAYFFSGLVTAFLMYGLLRRKIHTGKPA